MKAILKMNNHFKIKKNKMRLLLVKIQIKENNQDEIIRIKLLTANSQDKPVLHILYYYGHLGSELSCLKNSRT